MCTEIKDNEQYDFELEFDYEMTDLASFDTHLSLFQSEIQLSSYVEASSMEKYNGIDSTDITIVAWRIRALKLDVNKNSNQLTDPSISYSKFAN